MVLVIAHQPAGFPRRAQLDIQLGRLLFRHPYRANTPSGRSGRGWNWQIRGGEKAFEPRIRRRRRPLNSSCWMAICAPLQDSRMGGGGILACGVRVCTQKNPNKDTNMYFLFHILQATFSHIFKKWLEFQANFMLSKVLPN